MRLGDNRKVLFILFGLSLLFYGNSIRNDFNIDDSYVTVTNYPVKGKKYVPNNKLVSQGLKGLPEIWRSRYGHDAGSYDYRPVVVSVFALEYALFGQSPHLDHFLNIVFYALAVFYLFRVLAMCFEQNKNGRTFAFVCAVLFLVHPVHSEVVNNIKCRDELLVFLFGMLTLFHFIRYFRLKEKKHLLFSGLFILLSFFTKLNSILFVLLIPLTLLFFFEAEKKKIVFVFVALVGLFFVKNMLRDWMLIENDTRFYYHFENPLYTEKVSVFTKLLFALSSLGIYIKLLLWPHPLHFYYGTDMLPLHGGWARMEIILAVVFIAAAVYFCYRTKNKMAWYGLLFYLIAIGPLLNFIQPVAGIIGERLCFTASAGFVVFLSSVLIYVAPLTKANVLIPTGKPLFILVPVLAVSLFYTWNRNSEWRDEMTLFEHDVPSLERSAGANNLLANKYYATLSFGASKQNELPLAEKCMHYYKLAFSDDSTVFTALNNTGTILYAYYNRPDEALTYFQRAIRSKPDYSQAYENMGDCYTVLNKTEDAVASYEKAISLNDMQYRSYFTAMKLLIKLERMQEAGTLLKKGEKKFPADYSFTILAGDYYYNAKEYEKAGLKYEEAYAMHPGKELALVLFKLYSERNNADKANYYKAQYETFNS